MSKFDQWNQYFWSNSVKTTTQSWHLVNISFKPKQGLNCQSRFSFLLVSPYSWCCSEGTSLSYSRPRSPDMWLHADGIFLNNPMRHIPSFFFGKKSQISQQAPCVAPSDASPLSRGVHLKATYLVLSQYTRLESLQTFWCLTDEDFAPILKRTECTAPHRKHKTGVLSRHSVVTAQQVGPELRKPPDVLLLHMLTDDLSN